jgi:hypothetical protein
MSVLKLNMMMSLDGLRGRSRRADPWTGLWGPNPPYHHPVFVLTHHAREPLETQGGTTFYFVTRARPAPVSAGRSPTKGEPWRQLYGT